MGAAVPNSLYRNPQGGYAVIDQETGLWRDATPEESSGYVTPNVTLDPTTQQWSDGKEGAGFTATNPMSGSGATTGVAATPKYAHYGPTTGFSFGNLDNKQDLYYNDPSNRNFGYQMLTDYLNPNGSSSNYGSYLSSQAGEVFNRYGGEVGKDPSLKWVDYLEKIAPGFRDQFNSLSARSRGENPALYDSGTYLG